MWRILRCYLSGQHDYGVGCEPGTIFLKCIHCGRRSSGWMLEQKTTVVVRAAAPTPTFEHRPALKVVHPQSSGRVLRFKRSLAQ
jgi:hypothetical protein